MDNTFRQLLSYIYKRLSIGIKKGLPQYEWNSPFFLIQLKNYAMSI